MIIEKARPQTVMPKFKIYKKVTLTFSRSRGYFFMVMINTIKVIIYIIM